jgi:hypothetical protein
MKLERREEDKIIGALENHLWDNGFNNEISREYEIKENEQSVCKFETDEDDMIVFFDFKKTEEGYKFHNIKVL